MEAWKDAWMGGQMQSKRKLATQTKAQEQCRHLGQHIKRKQQQHARVSVSLPLP